MHSDRISEETNRVLANIGSRSFIVDFYLAGGTSLAIQVGHRQSVDLDFFSKDFFSVPDVKKELSIAGEYVVNYEDEKTLDGVLDGIKISFFHYDYDRLYPLIDFGKIKLRLLKNPLKGSHCEEQAPQSYPPFMSLRGISPKADDEAVSSLQQMRLLRFARNDAFSAVSS